MKNLQTELFNWVMHVVDFFSENILTASPLQLGIGNYLSPKPEKRKDLNIICQNWHSEVISFFDQFSWISRIFDRHFYQSWQFFLYCFGNVALTSIKGNNTRCKEQNCEKTCHVKKDLKNKCKNNNCASVLQKHLLGQTYQ